MISGPGRKMYQDLEPKPEGAIFPKRSKPQGGRNSTPHDTGTSMEDQLVTMNIQGGGRFPHRGAGGIKHESPQGCGHHMNSLPDWSPRLIWGPVRAKTFHASISEPKSVPA